MWGMRRFAGLSTIGYGLPLTIADGKVVSMAGG